MAGRGRVIASAPFKSVFGVVLAGGLASRMGGVDKPLLPLGNARVIDHVLTRLRPQVSRIAINANGDPARYAEFGLPILPDANDDRLGPLAGVLAGLDWAKREGGDAIITVAGDTPFFPTDLTARLAGARTAATPIALAATPHPDKGNMRHPTFGVWPVSLRDALEVALSEGVRKMVAWADRQGAATVVFEAGDIDPFFNLNTPDDYDAANALLAGNTL